MMAADATTGNADTPSQTPPVQPFPPLIPSPLSLKISYRLTTHTRTMSNITIMLRYLTIAHKNTITK